jgi:hypothetical protein
MRFWVWVGEPSWLSSSWAHALDYVLILLDRLGFVLGLKCPCFPVLVLCSDCFLIIREHCLGRESGGDSTQAVGGIVPGDRVGSQELTFDIRHLPYYHSLATYPFALSRMWLPAWNIWACWLLFLCLQPCWFPVHEHGLGKHSHLCLSGGGG